MLFGNRNLFAIESEIESIVDSWVFGYFRFWISQKVVGNYSDSTSLNGCFDWLKNFIENPLDRYEPGLINMPAEKVFYLLYDSFMPEGTQYSPVNKEPFEYTFRRFYISHLGMSSFDRFDILLVENDNHQRILWRDAKDFIIYNTILPVGTIQQVAEEFCQWFVEIQ